MKVDVEALQDDLNTTWRSLVITRAMGQGLFDVIMKFGGEKMKACAAVIVADAMQMEEDPEFVVEAPRDVNGGPKAKVVRRCLKCDGMFRSKYGDRICKNCKYENDKRARESGPGILESRGRNADGRKRPEGLGPTK